MSKKYVTPKEIFIVDHDFKHIDDEGVVIYNDVKQLLSDINSNFSDANLGDKIAVYHLIGYMDVVEVPGFTLSGIRRIES